MRQNNDRDFIGYADTPPDPRWPGGARLALNFVLNYEEGSEASIEDGETFSERALTESPGPDPDMKGRDLAAEGMFAYGSRVGFWRIMRLFELAGLPMTVYACALALERNPRAAAAIVAAGHDICCHGWRWEKHYAMDAATERDHIARAVASLIRTTGAPPAGWYCRYGPSVNTRRLLVEHGGFSYDSDAYDDDLPYWMAVQGRPHLIIPYTLTNNDTQFARGSIGTADDFFHFLRDAFDTLREEGGRMMSVGMHMRILGHPARAAGLRRFLAYVKTHGDVWVTRRLDIARHWTAVHPPA